MTQLAVPGHEGRLRTHPTPSCSSYHNHIEMLHNLLVSRFHTPSITHPSRYLSTWGHDSELHQIDIVCLAHNSKQVPIPILQLHSTILQADVPPLAFQLPQ